MWKSQNTSLFLVALIYTVAIAKCDLPCAARDVGIEGRSIVCVCNATYCDTVTRSPPAVGSYVVYTTSKSGKRFEKHSGIISRSNNGKYDDETQETNNGNQRSIWTSVTLNLHPSYQHQTIQGFGGSVTDAAGYNWNKLSHTTKSSLIRSYFSEEGLEYNIIRTPIGGSDFSTHPYTYNEYPWNDSALTNFTFSYEDIFLKVPMIKNIQSVAKEEVKVMASTWSPPVWMKTNERITGYGQIKPEHYQTYADYHIRFMELYKQAEIDIWAITTTNEPINGILPIVRFNSLGWFAADLGRWVGANLGPTIRNSRFNKTLIFAVDDQRYLLHWYLSGMERGDKNSLNFVDGIAVHYYGNFVPPTILEDLHRRYNKIMIATEACEGPMPWHPMKVKIGSWERAQRYAKYILEDLNHYMAGWIDWNLCLDENGGPNWAENFVDAPILVYPERDEFIKQPMFYAMGHFSKFIPRGSRRISVTNSILSFGRIDNAAFITPQGNIVLVLHNINTSDLNVSIRINNQHIDLVAEAESIKTVEINPN
ncbi:lysosomal acid glucosylceramidase-like [Zerene cesonia]|uniref:lysosomal acid glucosylceramidase-like n=1 Tax=Zerene cesonia TaxID=33412 RepID=UPI0018E53648|nr:lysosomal acid glucosylceramidase-like [Zerene cesonia]